MTKQYERAKKIFLEVCDLNPAQARVRLDDLCGDDAQLRAEVESLLEHVDGQTLTVAAGPTEVFEGFERQPTRIGPYRLIRELGRGGMGVVYLATREDAQFKQRVAVKVLKRGMDTEDILKRFELERQVLAGMNHPGIARLYDGGETEEGLPYFAIEYVEGQPIDEYCDTHRLRIGERLELFRLVCAAVHYAHQNLVIHRDLKPSNILVTKDGVPKLLDFGIAKIINPELVLIAGDPTAPEFRLMTPEYASPEQVRGDPLTTSSDVYSLGVLLYEIMTGHRPYRLRSRLREEIQRVICEVEPEKPSTAISRVEEIEPDESDTAQSTSITPELVSRVREGRPDRLRRRLAGDIDNIVLLAMRKEPQRRYQSAEQFAEDVRRHLDGLPVAARADTLGYRCSKFVRRHRIGVAASVLIGLSLLLGMSGTTWQARVAEIARGQEKEQRQIAEIERDRAQRMFDQVRDLAHTFLFDFHDQIQRLDGSVPARQLLVTTALEYLNGLTEEVADDPVLQRELASGYDKVGDIRGGTRNPSLGDRTGALEAYRSGLALRQSLVDVPPNDPELRKELSTSLMHVGDMLRYTGDVGGALASYRESIDHRQELATLDPVYRRPLAIGYKDAGQALFKMGRLDEAMEYYDRSLELRRQLAVVPTDSDRLRRLKPRDVSVQLIALGELLETIGDHDAAMRRYKEAISIRRTLSEMDLDSGRGRRDLSVPLYNAAKLLLTLDRTDQAKSYVDEFVALVTHRMKANPNDARAQSDFALSHELQGMVLVRIGDHEAALAHYGRLRQMAADFAALHPADTDVHQMRATAWALSGGAHAAIGDSAAALRDYRRALAIMTVISEADPANAQMSVDRGQLLLGLGALLAETADSYNAKEKLEAAQTIFEEQSRLQPDNVQVQEGLAESSEELSRLMDRRGD